jgi:hypothetical protein
MRGHVCEETLMADQSLPEPGLDATPANGTTDLADRGRVLEQVLAQKLEQGYQVESRGETDAIIVGKGRSRWFGLSNEAGSRQRVSVDDQGVATMRKC